MNFFQFFGNFLQKMVDKSVTVCDIIIIENRGMAAQKRQGKQMKTKNQKKLTDDQINDIEIGLALLAAAYIDPSDLPAEFSADDYCDQASPAQAIGNIEATESDVEKMNLALQLYSQYVTESANLTQLCERCNNVESTRISSYGYTDHLYSSLPTFGGDEPEDTSEIFSWDQDSQIVISHSGMFTEEYREDVE
ncbi:MAG: hypothetical protein KDK39_01295 [Leptospiraceae bacterium]|nr:hypothetical protein [Leptospiraceae bacterium]